MATEAQIRYGEIKFIEQCSRCHVFGPSVTSDLRKLPREAHDLFRDIVLNGALASRGMEQFGDVLSEADFDAIHAYLVDQSWQTYKAQDGVVTFGPCRLDIWRLFSTMTKISYAGYRFPPDIIQQAIWLYLRFTLSFRDVEDLLAERGIMVSYETVRRWVNHFGPKFAADLRQRRPKPHTTWHLDEV